MKASVRKFLTKVGKDLSAGSVADLRLAPWLTTSAPELTHAVAAAEAHTRKQFDDEDIGPADGFELDDSPISASDLREDGLDLPAEITDTNLAAWCCIHVTADDEEWSLYDAWMAVVRIGDGLAIGYVEFGEPD